MEKDKVTESSMEDIQKMLINYQTDPNVRKLYRLFKKKSITDIYGIARKERQHSKFIAWLLNPNESHGIDSFALKQLLFVIVRRGIQQNNTDSAFTNIKNDLLVPQLDTGNLSIVTEYSVKGGYIDIFVQNLNIGDKSVNIIIENKVESNEHDGQTQTYYKEVSERFPNTYNIYLFLTPKSSNFLDNITEASCDCKSFIEISYQDILTDILENILKEDISSQTRIIIEDYIHNITTPSSNTNNQNIMAMNNETQELLKDFWKSNEDLITAALQALASSGEDENAEKALQFLNKRDNSRYKLTDKDGQELKRDLGKRSLVREIVKYILDKNENKEVGEILESIDNRLKIDKLLKEEEKYIKDETRADVFKKGDNKYYINNQWTKEKIDELIDIIHDIPSLGIEITLYK